MLRRIMNLLRTIPIRKPNLKDPAPTWTHYGTDFWTQIRMAIQEEYGLNASGIHLMLLLASNQA